jgi:hypothetical protein
MAPATLVWGPPTETAAIITGPALVSRTTTALTINITVDMPCQAWLEYGTTTGYGAQTTTETSYLLSHTQVISGLSASTTYWVRPHVINQAGIETVGTPAQFATVTSGATLQALIDATSPGGTLNVAGQTFTTGAIINKAMTLVGSGTATLSFASGAQGLRVTSSTVVITGMVITGPGNTIAYNINSRGIDVRGTSAARISGLVVRDCVITQSNGFGMYINYPTGALIEDNTVTDILYTGIGLLSDLDSTVQDNVVRRIADRGIYPSVNAIYNGYGIFLSQADPAVDPRCVGTVVTGNTVTDVPTWHGLDTHGGRDCTWTNNTIARCNRAIWIGSATGYNPLNHTVSNNTMTEPTPRPDVVNQYPYNMIGISVLSGSSGVTGTGNVFDGWPSGNHVSSASGGGVYGPHSITGHTITNPI